MLRDPKQETASYSFQPAFRPGEAVQPGALQDGSRIYELMSRELLQFCHDFGAGGAFRLVRDACGGIWNSG